MKRGEGDTVDRHPDSDTLLAFREHRLAGALVAGVALHVGQCARCARVELAAGRSILAALAQPDADGHLTDTELDLLVDGIDDDPSYALVSRHAAVCAMCAAEVADLRRFAAEPAIAPAVAPAPRPQRWAIAAAVVVGLLALSAIALYLRRPAPAPVPITASNAPAPVAPAPAIPPAPKVVASLADGDGRVALLEDGTIAGVELRSPRDAADTRAVLSGGSIAIPAFITAMPGAVRGADPDAHPFRAIEPFRSSVLDARPRFAWTPLPGARSYRVAVFDADYEEVAHSEPLTGTSWTPPEPLPGGADLSWHVVADREAGELSSAGADRAEAVFRVLTPQEAAEVELGRTHYRDSHLLRGLLYSRHGLLHDARREFRRLGEQNPGSPVARALIESVSR